MKIITAAVGIALISTSFVLAYLSSNNVEKLENNKQAIIQKYIDNSNQELENNNFKGAIKFAKLAIAVDAKSKEAFKNYENIIELKYKPNEEEGLYEENSSEQPSKPESDEEEAVDMGC